MLLLDVFLRIALECLLQSQKGKSLWGQVFKGVGDYSERRRACWGITVIRETDPTRHGGDTACAVPWGVDVKVS